jgi:hypothetical protein
VFRINNKLVDHDFVPNDEMDRSCQPVFFYHSLSLSLSHSLSLALDDDASRSTVPKKALNLHEYSSKPPGGEKRDMWCVWCEKEIFSQQHMIRTTTSWFVVVFMFIPSSHRIAPYASTAAKGERRGDDMAAVADNGGSSPPPRDEMQTPLPVFPRQPTQPGQQQHAQHGARVCPLWEEEGGESKRRERGREIFNLAVCISEFLPSPHNNNGEKKKESPWKLGAVRFHLPRLVF